MQNPNLADRETLERSYFCNDTHGVWDSFLAFKPLCRHEIDNEIEFIKTVWIH